MAETMAGGVAKDIALFHNPAITEIQRREMVGGGRQHKETKISHVVAILNG
jgi:hypothetical protein